MKKFSKTKKVIVILAAAGLVIGLTTATTMALIHNNTQTVTNNFKGTGVNVGVIESDNSDASVYENETGNTNSYVKITENNRTVTKEVSIKNITSDEYPTTDTYVRVRLVPSWVYDSGDNAGQIVPVDLIGKITYHFDKDNSSWVYNKTSEETYFYYTKALAPGETSGKLLSQIQYTGDIPENAHFELQVLTEGIAANQKDESGKSSLSAWGVDDFGSMTKVPETMNNN